MARQNVRHVRPAVTSPIVSECAPSGQTALGAPGFQRTEQAELYLLAVTNFVSEDTFHEGAVERDDRYAALVRACAVADPEWTARMLKWLRTEANMRTASIVGAAEFTKARLGLVDEDPNYGVRVWTSRKVINSVLLRGDEPGEFLAYWASKYGKNFPKAVKRGVGDAVIRLGNELNYVKWDSESRGWRYADILRYTHPGDRRAAGQRFQGAWQSDLFELITKGGDVPDSLHTLTRRQAMLSMPVDERRQVLESPDVLREAGMTWEALAGWLQGPMDAAAWEAIIPSMGYMALLRNLRNFDQAGVSDEVAESVAARLADPEQVAKSRQLPMRFLSAYRAVPSLRWGAALEKALGLSLANVPVLTKKTLVLVDTSASMNRGFSKDGTLMRWDAAAIFGIALAGRCEHVSLVSFSSDYYGGTPSKVFPLHKAESVLRSLDRWKNGGYFINAGTDTDGALRAHFGGHDRVLILTDEQAEQGPVGDWLPADVVMYTANLAGYRYGHAASGMDNRHVFGGLNDKLFQAIPLLESGKNGAWPF